MNPTSGLVIIPPQECRALLASAVIGRVVTSIGALPAAFPVNFATVDDSIIFRSQTGTKLTAALSRAVVAFQVDDFDYLHRTGWSVLVVGESTVVQDPAELRRLQRLDLTSWVDVKQASFIVLPIARITGRRIGQ